MLHSFYSISYRLLKVVSCFLLISLVALIGTSCSHSEKVDNTLTDQLKVRLGTDDGYTLAITYGADIRGNLDDCGCHAHPMGGLAWRMGYIEGFRKLSSDVPILQIDAGNFFSDAMDSNEVFFPDTIERNKWILKGYQQANFTVANISYHELPYLVELLKTNQSGSTPFVDKLVSCNIDVAGSGLPSIKPYIIKEVESNRIDKKRIRIGFTGITMKGISTNAVKSSYIVNDPYESLKKIVPELRSKVDVLVVMAYAIPTEVEKLAEITGVDIVVGAQNGTGGLELKKIGAASVVYTFSQTKQLGDLRIYMTREGKIKEIKNRFVVLDKEIPKDPVATKIISEAKSSIEAAQRANTRATPNSN